MFLREGGDKAGGHPSNEVPLLVIHGLFGSGDNWSSVASQLSDRRVLMPDLINHGQSPHVDDFGFESMARDVLETMDAAGVDRFDVLGHSLGGKVAMLLALTAPQRTRRLVVVDVSPKAYEERHRFIIEALKAVSEAGCASRKEADQVLQEHIPHKPIRSFLLKNFVPTNGTYDWRINLRAVDVHYRELVGWPDVSLTFDGPVMAVGGGRSSYVTPEDKKLFQSYFPTVRFHILRTAGHWVHSDARREFLDLVREFLGTT